MPSTVQMLMNLGRRTGIGAGRITGLLLAHGRVEFLLSPLAQRKLWVDKVKEIKLSLNRLQSKQLHPILQYPMGKQRLSLGGWVTLQLKSRVAWKHRATERKQTVRDHCKSKLSRPDLWDPFSICWPFLNLCILFSLLCDLWRMHYALLETD